MTLMEQLVAELRKASEAQGASTARPRLPEHKVVRTLEALRDSDDPDTAISRPIYEAAKDLDWDSPAMSFKKMRGMCVKDHRKLGEAQSSTAFGQLLRAGIQQIANGWYIDAQAYRDSNPQRAIQLCRDIEQMLPSSSDLNRRAAQLRRDLE